MNFFQGISYNLKGLVFGLKTPKLLALGILRFAVVIILTVMLSGFILTNHEEILNLMWTIPEGRWLVILWNIVSWLLSLFLAGISVLIAYLVAQVLFCVFIMDYMSRITEKMVSGKVTSAEGISIFSQMIYLIKQEIPRAVIPVVLMVILMMAGFLTPLGPVIAVLSTLSAAVFLAWDNTDLIPARRMLTFKNRFDYLKQNLGFHLGFGLWFLIPWLNILFLSFAPVGAALYYIDNADKG